MHPESDDASSVGSSEAFNYSAYSAYSAPATSVTMGSGPVPSVMGMAQAKKPTGAAAAKSAADRSLTISTNAPMKATTKKAPASLSSSENNDDDGSVNDGAAGSRPEHLKPRLCTVPGCKKRVRSKGLCKAHGGGRRCMVEGCERSSQGQGLCIRHGGGKRCTQPGCTKASQSNGLCKAHGGGLRCMAGNCTKSSQGGGFCRAHGGGQRCEKEGCNKGAQRGGFCAGHGGSRFCQHPDCTKNDRGGGFCAEHGGGKRCDQQGCNKPARKKGKCSYHANASKAKTPKDQVPGGVGAGATSSTAAGVAAPPPPMMDMRQLTAPAAAYNPMQGMPQAAPKVDATQLRDAMDQHAALRSSYPPVSSYQPRVDLDQRYSKGGYDQHQPLPMASNPAATNPYMSMHGGGDQRGYEPMGMAQAGPSRGHYMDSSSLPSVSQGYKQQQQAPHPGVSSMVGMDRSASPYEPVRASSHPGHQGHPMQHAQHAGYSQHSQHWSTKDTGAAAPGRAGMDFYDMKDQSSHHQPQYGAPPTYHHHMQVDAAYGNARDNYYTQQPHHHAPSGAAPNDNAMYGSYNYQPHQMHSMNLL